MKMGKWARTAVLVFCCALISACAEKKSKKNSNGPSTIDINKITSNSLLTDSEKAEALVDVAEALVTPTSFMYADEVFDKALEFNGEHKKAQFYKAFLKPQMAMKGMLRRIEPLSRHLREDLQEDYKYYSQKLILDNGLQRFLLAEGSKIYNEKEIQSFIDEYLSQLNEFREFIKKNKSEMEFNVILTATRSYMKNRRQIWDKCLAIKIGEGQYNVSKCEYYYKVFYQLDRVDFEVIQNMIAGQQIVTTLSTGYDLSGSINYAKNQSLQASSDQIVLGYFKAERDFGRLRETHKLPTIQSLGIDAYSGAKWARKSYATTCTQYRGDRSGHLASSGICVRDHNGIHSTDAIFGMLDVAFSGQALEAFTEGESLKVSMLEYDQSGADMYTKVNYLAPVTNPVGSLKSLFPSEFDDCGNAQNVGDNTLAGAFPQGDANEVLESIQSFETSCW